MSDFKPIKKYIDMPLTDDQKIERYENIIRRRLAWWEEKANIIRNKEITKLAGLELSGGECHCGISWEKIKFDNYFGKGVYYVPNCDCYMSCPVCRCELYDFQVVNYFKIQRETKCPECGFYLIYENEKRWGTEYRQMFEAQPLWKKRELMLVGNIGEKKK